MTTAHSKDVPFVATLERAGLTSSSDSFEARYFDGTHTHIHAGAIRQSIVSIHEQIHERICVGLPDGQALFFASALCRSPNLGRKQLRVIARNRAKLFAASERAHEVFATYLSTNSLSATDVPEVLSLYDDVYTDFYVTLSGVLDEHVSSTYLRFIVAWGMCSAVFASRLIVRLGLDGLFNDFDLDATEKPNDRLDRLLKVLTPEILRSVVAGCQTVWDDECSLTQSSSWDLSAEEHWLKNHDRAVNAEKVAIENAYAMFCALLSGAIVSDAERTHWATLFIEKYYPYLSHVYGSLPSSSTGQSVLKTYDDHLDWWQADARIENRCRKSCFVREHESLPKEGDLIVIRPAWDNRANGWAVFFEDDDPALADYVMLTDDDLATALFSENERSKGQGESERVLVLIDTFPTLEELIDFANRYHSDGDVAEDSKTIGYVHSNWLNTATAFLDLGYSIRVGLTPTFEWQPQGLEMPANMGMIISVMAVDGLPIWLVKAVNPVAANCIGRILTKLDSHQNLRWFEKDEQRFPAQLLGVGMGVLMRAWDRL